MDALANNYYDILTYTFGPQSAKDDHELLCLGAHQSKSQKRKAKKDRSKAKKLANNRMQQPIISDHQVIDLTEVDYTSSSSYEGLTTTNGDHDAHSNTMKKNISADELARNIYRQGRKAVCGIVATDDEPMKEPFVGGAEQARRNARKNRNKTHNNMQSSNRTNRTTHVVDPRTLAQPPASRFFSLLLFCPLDELMDSNISDLIRCKLIQEICMRAGLPVPTFLPNSNSSADEFYSLRAALILEEARYILSDALLNLFTTDTTLVNFEESQGLKRTGTCIGNQGITCSLDNQRKKTGFVQITFSHDFTLDESENRYHFDFIKKKAACVVLLTPISDPSVHSHILAYVDSANSSNDDDQLTVSVYNVQKWSQLISNQYHDGWRIVLLVSLNKELRQFEVCSRKPQVAFMRAILGMMPRHIRFNVDETSKTGEEDHTSDNNTTNQVPEIDSSSSYVKNLAYYTTSVPTLNPSQNTAAEKFLVSSQGTITLIQVNESCAICGYIFKFNTQIYTHPQTNDN